MVERRAGRGYLGKKVPVIVYMDDGTIYHADSGHKIQTTVQALDPGDIRAGRKVGKGLFLSWGPMHDDPHVVLDRRSKKPKKLQD